jgi:hypothetical protein
LILDQKDPERQSSVYVVPTMELMSEAEALVILAGEGDKEALAALDLTIPRLAELRDQARTEAGPIDEEQ